MLILIECFELCRNQKKHRLPHLVKVAKVQIIQVAQVLSLYMTLWTDHHIYQNLLKRILVVKKVKKIQNKKKLRLKVWLWLSKKARSLFFIRVIRKEWIPKQTYPTEKIRPVKLKVQLNRIIFKMIPT